ETDAAKGRATLHRTGGTTVEIVPSAGQLQYCLAFTHSAKGVTRQLTMSRSNLSFDCKAGSPIGGVAFRVPLDEGAVKMLVLFTSEPVNAASIAQQLLEYEDLTKLNAMELRLPGRAALELLDFTPEADVAPTTGQVLGGSGGADAGAP